MSQVLSSKRVVIAAAAILAIVVALFVARTGAARADEGISVVLRNASGARVGEAKLTQQTGKVLVRAVVHHLAPGFHGFHVHAIGQCVAPFTSAGGHHNPGGTGHGLHAGDMPSLLVNGDGSAELRFRTDRFTVKELLDADGSAIIVHAGADNFANIPSRYHSHTEDVLGPDSVTLATGDAGGRLACGVIH